MRRLCGVVALLGMVTLLVFLGCGRTQDSKPLPPLTDAERAAMDQEGRIGNAAEAEQAAETAVREALHYSEDVEFSWADAQPEFDVAAGVWKVKGFVEGKPPARQPPKTEFSAHMFVAADANWHFRELAVGDKTITGDRQSKTLNEVEKNRVQSEAAEGK